MRFGGLPPGQVPVEVPHELLYREGEVAVVRVTGSETESEAEETTADER